MHAQPPRTLKRLLKQYGQELIDDPRRTEALLRDHCGQHTREIFVLVNAQKQRVPNDLLAAPAWMPRQATYTRLSRLLQTKLAITEDAADWAVASWAAALELESMPKGDGWSWLPGKKSTPQPASGRKPRSKKRQNSPSSVQSTKSATRQSAKRAKARAARAELGWGFPTVNVTWLEQLVKSPATWANVLPWVALVAASLFLLAVVYWTSSMRDEFVGLPAAPGAVTTIAASGSANGNDAATNSATVRAPIGTPLPDFDRPANEYLGAIISLPAWANVSDAATTLFIRQQPLGGADVLGFLSTGEPVEVVAFSADGRWSQIARPQAGWVSNDFLTFQSEDATHSAVQLDVQTRRAQRYEVAVRAAPDANAEVIATLAPDAQVVVAATMDDPASWVQIADPTVGWVAASDLAPISP